MSETRQCPGRDSEPVDVNRVCKKCSLYEPKAMLYACKWYVIHHNKRYAPLKQEAGKQKIAEIRKRMGAGPDGGKKTV